MEQKIETEAKMLFFIFKDQESEIVKNKSSQPSFCFLLV
jgi:hypothetical protein